MNTSIKVIKSGVNLKTVTNGHILFSNNKYSVNMHDNFQKGNDNENKIKTTGRPRERYKDKILKCTEKRGEKSSKRGRKEERRVDSLETTR